MKDIKDYLKYYIGQKAVLIREEDGNIHFILTAYNYNYYKDWHSDIRPKLRRFDSMTEEEAIEVAKCSEYEDHFRDVKVETNKFKDLIVTWQGSNESREVFNATGEAFYCSEQFHYLLSKGFDLFDLIDSGVAIDINHSN